MSGGSRDGSEVDFLQKPDGYETVLGSWPDRDGMFLELYDCRTSRELVLWAFYSDLFESFEFERYKEVPPEVESWFHNEARRRLPPIPLT
jgi:hypothetical protein